jgi:hypothetical protein
MNKKIILLLLSCVVVVLLIISGYLFWRSNHSKSVSIKDPTPLNTTAPFDDTPTADPQTKPVPFISVSGEKIIFKTPRGDVSVNNFYKNPQTQVFEQGSPGEYAILVNSGQYTMDYRNEDRSFGIVLNDPNLQVARRAAEKYFLEKLGITETQACKLVVSVGVPISVGDGNASGVDYHLSFCPDGVPLP